MTKLVRTTGKSEFEFGLDLILDGLEQMHDGASPPAASKAPRTRRSVPKSGRTTRERTRAT